MPSADCLAIDFIFEDVRWEIHLSMKQHGSGCRVPNLQVQGLVPAECNSPPLFPSVP